MANTPPTFVSEHETAWNVALTPKGQTWTPASGDVVLAMAAKENQNSQVLQIAGGLTWTIQKTFATGTQCPVLASSAVGGGSSITANIQTSASGGDHFGGNFLQFSGSDGIGASAGAQSKTGTHPQQAVTTLFDNSALVVIFADFNAVSHSGAVWDTVNGFAPTVANGKVVTDYVTVSTDYGVLIAYYPDAGVAGSKTVGITLGSSVSASMIVVEVRGEAPSVTPISGSDTAALTETTTRAISGTSTDLGTLTEASSTVRITSVTDSAALTDGSAVAGSGVIVGVDSATLGDSSGVVTLDLIVGSDSGTLSESSSVDEGGGPSGEYTGWDTIDPGLTFAADADFYTMGTAFYVTNPGQQVLGARLWLDLLSNTTDLSDSGLSASLWAVDTEGAGFAVGTAYDIKMLGSVTDEVLGSWYEIRFDTPIDILDGEANTYVIAVSVPRNVYSALGHFFDSGDVAAPSGAPIVFVADVSSGDFRHRNGQFHAGTQIPTAPDGSFNAAFYGVDVIIQGSSDGPEEIDTSDSGSLTDSGSLSVTLTATDSGALVDSSEVFSGVDVAGVDSATLTESTARAISGTATDLGTLTDSSSVSSAGAPTATDTATLADSSATAKTNFITGEDSAELDDSATDLTISDGADGTLTETTALLAALSRTDTGTLGDSGAILQGVTSKSGTDSGTLTESSALVVALSSTESYALADISAITIIGVNPASSDLFTLTETPASISGAVGIVDSGNLGDQGNVATTGPATDSGTLGQTGILAVLVSGSDLGSLVDAGIVGVNQTLITAADAFALAEQVTVGYAYLRSDGAILSESAVRAIFPAGVPIDYELIFIVDPDDLVFLPED